MKQIDLDTKNYKENGSVFKRVAVRGIIKRGDLYLIIVNKYGDHKFPGGGQNQGETLEETLLREVQEESGYLVKKDSIKEYIVIHERRRGMIEDILEMDSYYYLCEVEEELGERNLDEYEQEEDFQVAWLPIREIYENNENIITKSQEFLQNPDLKNETLKERDFEVVIAYLTRENIAIQEILKAGE